MKKLNLREIILAIIVFCSVVIFLFITSVCDPLVEKSKQIEEMIDAKNIKFYKLQKIIADKEKYTGEFKDVAEIPKLNDSEEVVNAKLLKIIDDIQKVVGVQIVNLVPIKPEEISFYKTFQVKVEIQDSMVNLIRFIMELRDTSEKLNLVNLHIVPGRGGKDDVKASFTVAQLMALK
ncbi:MAG: hypothetical protein ACD_79C00825G0004 [uncultured bacterium]|nr:MAG: hypothetical protein ACD_79C00825G0004 [uncultured bacterium]